MGAKGGVFRYADDVDKLLLLFGTLGSIGEGLLTPFTLALISGIINKFSRLPDLQSAAVFDATRTGDQFALKLSYICVGVSLAAFAEGACWTRTAERQTSRMRKQYLKSVLRQEVAFFDSQFTSSPPFQVISGITTDAEKIQDVVSEKMPHFLSNTATYIGCFIVSFTLSWRLAALTLPLILLFLIPMMGFGKLMVGVGLKMKDA